MVVPILEDYRSRGAPKQILNYIFNTKGAKSNIQSGGPKHFATTLLASVIKVEDFLTG